MKTILLLALATLSIESLSSQACDMTQGFHEFETFGEQSLYLSHYPMFGSVHSQQLLLNAEVYDGERKITDQVLAYRKSHPGTSLTTSPIRSDGSDSYAHLPDFAKIGTRFQARIHGEDRKGKAVEAFTRVTVVVTAAPINRIIDQPRVGAPAEGPNLYYQVGDAKEAYLVHRLYWNPDFEQILKIAPGAYTATGACASKSAVLITLANKQSLYQTPVRSGLSLAGKNECGQEVTLQALDKIYESEMTIQK